MSTLNRHRTFCNNRLARLTKALEPLSRRHDNTVGVICKTTCLSGHPVSILLVPAEWVAATATQPADLNQLTSTPPHHQHLLATGICRSCHPDNDR